MPRSIRSLFAAAIAAGALLLAASGPAAAEQAGEPLQFAQFSDPSLPLPPPGSRRSRRAPRPEIPPFALPTAPIGTPTGAPPKPDASALPGGAEFPPYEKELLRLAEILGAVGYLRGLCGAEDATVWRQRMQDLLEAEGAKDAWRARLIGSFNKGYRGFEGTHRACTPVAERAVQIYLAEGQQLSGAIKAKYAN